VYENTGKFHGGKMIKRATLSMFILAAIAVASPITLTLNSANGQQVGGDYVSPYSATIEPANLTFPVFCDDFVDQVNLGETWDVTIEQGTNTTGAKFAAADYPVLFWLAEQDTSATYITTQLSMWTETDPGFTGATTASNALLTTARADQSSVDLAEWQVYTPTGYGQEQIADSPEPSTIVLIGLGLVAVGLLRRKSLRGGC